MVGKKQTPIYPRDLHCIMGVCALITFIAAALWPVEAWADTTAAASLGDIICNIRSNISPFLPLFSAIAYIAGAVLVLNGTLLLKKHADNPNDSQVVKGVAHLLGGGALAAFSTTIYLFQNTLGLAKASSSGVLTCKAAVPASSATGLDTMMQNFVNNIYSPMFSALSVLCFVMGAFLIYRGLLKGSKVGTDPRAAATHAIVVNLVVGAILVSIGGMLPNMLTTLFGDPNIKNFSSIINWSAITGSGVDTAKADLTVHAILMFVQIIGAIAFVRGWLIIKSAVEGTGQTTVPQGITHVIGGTMAINIGLMLKLFDSTFGTGLIN
ncbi:MAG: hypothetical protein PHY92_10975 [Alphaproteobacteria bacterium]|nr:hypothetical protein [Alphaproteobacteria bacterium]